MSDLYCLYHLIQITVSQQVNVWYFIYIYIYIYCLDGRQYEQKHIKKVCCETGITRKLCYRASKMMNQRLPLKSYLSWNLGLLLNVKTVSPLKGSSILTFWEIRGRKMQPFHYINQLFRNNTSFFLEHKTTKHSQRSFYHCKEKSSL